MLVDLGLQTQSGLFLYFEEVALKRELTTNQLQAHRANGQQPSPPHLPLHGPGPTINHPTQSHTTDTSPHTLHFTSGPSPPGVEKQQEGCKALVNTSGTHQRLWGGGQTDRAKIKDRLFFLFQVH